MCLREGERNTEKLCLHVCVIERDNGRKFLWVMEGKCMCVCRGERERWSFCICYLLLINVFFF